MAVDINVKDDQTERTTRQTKPKTPGGTGNLFAPAPGYNQYGNSPLYGRLPTRSLNAFNLQTLNLLELDPLAALELLPLIFPDASLAVHNILRLGNPGWEIKVYHAVTGKEDKKAGLLCRAMMEKANRGVDCEIPGAMGGPDSLINSLLFSAYIKGAVCVEAVLDETLSLLDDIVPVDPFSILFEEKKEKRGRYNIFQVQEQSVLGEETVPPVQTMPSQGRDTMNNKVQLNPNLITYVPLDESLYGRSMVAPALQLLIFWTRYYIALQVYLHNVAFGDKDGEIDTLQLLTILDKNMTPQDRKKWERDFWGELVKLVNRFADDYKANVKRDPNSAMIHSDLLKMSALGTARSAYPVKEVMEVMKKEIYAALKMLPIMMGANDTVTETHATVQMQIFASGLNYIQGAVKHAIERALLTGLRAGGYDKNVRVDLEFLSISLEDRLKKALADAQELENEAFKVEQGWQSQDEASTNATGSPAVMDGPNGEPAENPKFERIDNTPPPPAAAVPPEAGSIPSPDNTNDQGKTPAKGEENKPRRFYSRQGRAAMGTAPVQLSLNLGGSVPAAATEPELVGAGSSTARATIPRHTYPVNVPKG